MFDKLKDEAKKLAETVKDEAKTLATKVSDKTDEISVVDTLNKAKSVGKTIAGKASKVKDVLVDDIAAKVKEELDKDKKSGFFDRFKK